MHNHFFDPDSTLNKQLFQVQHFRFYVRALFINVLQCKQKIIFFFHRFLLFKHRSDMKLKTIFAIIQEKQIYE